MRAVIVLLITILFGCSTVTPEYQSCTPIWHLKSYNINYCGEQPHSMDFESYIQTFEKMWNENIMFPYDPRAVHAALDNITIFWQPYIFRAPDQDNRMLGLTYWPPKGRIRMYVYIPINCRNSTCTALGHELLHVAYGAVAGDMYTEHLNNGPNWPDYHIKFIEKVNQAYLNI